MRRVLWFALTLATLGVAFSIFLGDWSAMGPAAVSCQRRARWTIGVGAGVLVVTFIVVEIVSPIAFI